MLACLAKRTRLTRSPVPATKNATICTAPQPERTLYYCRYYSYYTTTRTRSCTTRTRAILFVLGTVLLVLGAACATHTIGTLLLGQTSTRAIAHAYNRSVFQMDEMSLGRFRVAHEDAVFYDMASRELVKVGMHKGIVIGDELTDEAVAIFSTLCSLFPPTSRSLNTSICEQTFSWVKNYGTVVNAMRANRQPS